MLGPTNDERGTEKKNVNFYSRLLAYIYSNSSIFAIKKRVYEWMEKKEWKNNQDKCKNCSHFPSDEQRANKPERSTANSSVYSFSRCLFVSLSMMQICCYFGEYWEEQRYLGELEIVTLIEFN